MALSSLQLEAFLAVSRTQNFTQAAEALHITQSALSQRIKNLEEELGATLFSRDPSGAKTTEVGQRLLRFCQAREGLEIEFLEQMKSKGPGDLRGTIRIAGYSSINRSLVLPALQSLTSKHEFLQIDLITAELFEIPQLLTSGRADFVFTNETVSRAGVITKLIGHERNVVIESSVKSISPAIYLDQHERDTATFEYFKFINRKLPKEFRRSFVGNIDSILTGVELGMGRAVAPRHLLKSNPKIEVVKGFDEQRIPVYLTHFEQPYYTEIHQAFVSTLEKKLAPILKSSGSSKA